MPEARIALVGAGLIGCRHAAHIRAEATLVAVVDPAAAADLGAPTYPDLATLLAHDRPDGILVATPNALHLEHGLQAIAAGIPVLIEKPLADTLPAARRLVDAAEQARVPLLVGHHRRHNPLIQAAKRAIDSGRLGLIVSAHAICWFHKPATYFDIPWHRQPGAGPLLINAIHDLDLLPHLVGEVVQVQAMTSHHTRALPVEDTVVLLLRFANGALGTLTCSDTIASPWSWEFTSGENPAYTRTQEASLMIGGTMGSLAIPSLSLWSHSGPPDWLTPLGADILPTETADPLALQIRNFADVIAGRAIPLVPGREGLATLRLALACHQAAASGRSVEVTHAA